MGRFYNIRHLERGNGLSSADTPLPMALIGVMHPEKQVSPEFVGNIHGVIWRQASAKLSNFRVVRHIAPRLQIQYFQPEVPFDQKSHNVEGETLTLDFQEVGQLPVEPTSAHTPRDVCW